MRTFSLIYLFIYLFFNVLFISSESKLHIKNLSVRGCRITYVLDYLICSTAEVSILDYNIMDFVYCRLEYMI